jgi:uncharacterized phage protein (TIGR02218 family)
MTQFIRTASPELTALLNTSRSLVVDDCFTITVPTLGLTLRWTASDVPVSFGGTTWTLGPGIERGRLVRTMGLEGGELEVTMFDRPSGPTLVAGQPLVPWVLRGGLDGAEVTLQQVFRAFPGAAPVGVLTQHVGQVGDAQTSGRNGCLLTVRSRTWVFNRSLPQSIYQPKCRTQLYSALCGKVRGTYTYNGTVGGAATAGRTRMPHSLPQEAGWFDLGVVVFTSGALLGLRRSVRRQTTTEIVFMQPLPGQVQAGDTFEIYPGCDLTLETCTTKFANRARFMGMPFIPSPDSIT